jgi:hypothetical protein
MMYLTDIGQIFASGMSRSANTNRFTEGQFIGFSPIVGESTAVNIPVAIQYAR